MESSGIGSRILQVIAKHDNWAGPFQRTIRLAKMLLLLDKP